LNYKKHNFKQKKEGDLKNMNGSTEEDEMIREHFAEARHPHTIVCAS
jgi:hypothetical protein